jgi:hypothetical protein
MLSVVICSIDADKFARVRRNLAERFAGVSHEIVVLNDARSLAEAYGRALAVARGSLVLFCHDDIEIVSDAPHARIEAALAVADVAGIAGTSRLTGPKWITARRPHVHGHVITPAADGRWTLSLYGTLTGISGGLCALDGVFIAARRETFQRVGFDAEHFDGFHLYDIDFSFRAWQEGLELCVCNEIDLIHASPGHFGAEWQRHAERFVGLHGADLMAPVTPDPARLHLDLFVDSAAAAVEACRRIRAEPALLDTLLDQAGLARGL